MGVCLRIVCGLAILQLATSRTAAASLPSSGQQQAIDSTSTNERSTRRSFADVRSRTAVSLDSRLAANKNPHKTWQPTVSLTGPANGAAYIAAATIIVSASASEKFGTI